MEIIDKFLTINDDFMLKDASKYINPTYVDKNGCLSIFPPQFLLEGVFAAILIKK